MTTYFRLQTSLAADQPGFPVAQQAEAAFNHWAYVGGARVDRDLLAAELDRRMDAETIERLGLSVVSYETVMATRYGLRTSLVDGATGFRTAQGVVRAINTWAKAVDAHLNDPDLIHAELARQMGADMVEQLGLSVAPYEVEELAEPDSGENAGSN
jgi:RNA-binding protein YhbY